MNRISVSAAALSILLVFISASSYAQMTITGPSCVLAGTEYQYILNRGNGGMQRLQICITGGIFPGNDGLCQTTSNAFVRVKWKEGQAATITVSSGGVTASMQIIVTTPLYGGKITNGNQKQTVTAFSTPAAIRCSKATGGSCSALYKYQWQESVDGTIWRDIPGSTSHLLEFSSPITETRYYRRRVTEVVSGSEGFSDLTFITVNKRLRK